MKRIYLKCCTSHLVKRYINTFYQKKIITIVEYYITINNDIKCMVKY